MKKLSLISATGIVTLLAGSVFGASIALPDLSPVATGTPVAGQSRLYSVFTAGDFVTVDWIVARGDYTLSDGMGGLLVDLPTAYGTDATDFIYMYQVENLSTAIPSGGSTPTDVGFLTISGWDTSLFGPTSAQFFATGSPDLDVANLSNPAHDSSAFGNLAGEDEPTGTTSVTCGAGCGNVGATQVRWGFEGTAISPDTEGVGFFFFVTKQPPTYGFGQVQDGGVPSPWTSGPGAGGFDGQLVPIPAPEPGTVLLLGLGLLGLGLQRRRAK